MNTLLRIPLCYLMLILSVSLPAQAENLPTFYEEAKDAYRQARYKTAASLFHQHLNWLEAHPQEDQTSYIKTHTKLGDTYRRQRLFKKSLAHYEVAMNASRNIESYKEWYLDAATNRAFVYSKMFDPLRAIRETEAVMPLAEELFGQESSDYANMYMNNGIDYYKTGDYRLSNQAFLKALDIFRKVSDPDSEDFNRIYNNLGGNYRKMGDYPKALEYAHKALEIKLKNYPAHHPGVAKYHMNIGKVYADMGQPEKALPFLEHALQIERRHYPDNHPNVTGMKGEIANVMADMGQYEQALDYYWATLKTDTKYMTADHPYILAMYANIARVYMETGRFDEALQMHRQGIEKLEKRDYIPPDQHTEMLGLLSEIYDAMGETEDALESARDGLLNLARRFDPEDPYELPKVEAIFEKRLFLVLSSHVIKLHEKLAQSGHDDHRTYALRTSETAIEVIHALRSSYHSDAARRTIHREASDIFEAAVRNAFLLYETSGNEAFLIRAFNWSEAAKANLIKQTVNEGLALRSASIPEELLETLDALKLKINQTENDLENARQRGLTQIFIDSIQAEFFEQKERGEALIRSIERNYPEYYRLKFASPSTDINTLQSKLKARQQSMVTYFYDHDDLFLFYLNGKNIRGYKKSHAGQLPGMADQLRAHLTPAAALKADSSDIRKLSLLCTDLYTLLIEPIKTQLDAGPKALIVVPHGVLHYLSFDLLHPEPVTEDLRKADFLIKILPIYYTVSSSLWARNALKETTIKMPYTGFAPSYEQNPADGSERTGFSRLLWNEQEVERANELFNGEIYTSENASEQQFKSISEPCGILHLAMHAHVNDITPMNSGLIFSPGADSLEDGYLNLYEIYNMRIPAETVVMNACNTGFGELAEGEGVMSLANAFSHAGCKNLVMNLWLADDQSSSGIIADFYHYLKKGLSKEAALRNAKLDYLKKADKLRCHPYFWSGLALQKNHELNNQESKMWYWSLIFAAIFILLLFILKLLFQRNLYQSL